MNPARSFAPDLVLNRFDHLWVYFAGPLAGAVVAVGAAWVLRGSGGSTDAKAAARGTLE
jgi:aquaporin Z